VTQPPGHLWSLFLPVVFGVVSGLMNVGVLLEPGLIGSHAVAYTEAARVWLAGGNPWEVGPPAVVFAGPPPMLLVFLPFVVLPDPVTRIVWVLASAGAAGWSFRRMGLPGWWIGFPPVFSAIILGHPEPLILALLVSGRSLVGIALPVKPYAVLPVLAERRYASIVVASIVVVVTLPFLPWPLFFEQLPQISATLVRQATGGVSVFGDPILMVVAVGALLLLGQRRALWLATPVLWPAAQPIYKTLSIPALSPVTALLWAVPVPGLTLAGLVTEAVMDQIGRRRRLPSWLSAGLRPVGLRALPPPGPSLTRRVT
jgi:hypothetical protein